MEHIDEGTIHAWLDGALSPGEGERIETHVRDCPECAAAVAEARGFIAASSRILSALDDVPSGVVPQRIRNVVEPEPPSEERDQRQDVSASTPSTARGAGGRRHRPWWRRPQFAAAAGIAFVAFTATVVWQRSVVPAASGVASDEAISPSAPPPELDQPAPRLSSDSEPSVAKSASNAGGGHPAVAPGAMPSNEETMMTRRSAPAAAPLASSDPPAAQRQVAEDARTHEARIAEASTDTSVLTRRSEAPSAIGSSVAPAPAPKAARARALADSRADSSSVAGAAAPLRPAVAPPRQVAGGVSRAADSATAKRSIAMSADAITQAEKARVAGEREVQLQAVVTTGARSEIAVTGNYTTVAGIAGCYRLQRSLPAIEARIPEMVVLDTTPEGTHDGAVLHLARLVGVETPARTQWRWSLAKNGSVALVRLQDGAFAKFPLALRMADQTGETSIATRINCPAR